LNSELTGALGCGFAAAADDDNEDEERADSTEADKPAEATVSAGEASEATCGEFKPDEGTRVGTRLCNNGERGGELAAELTVEEAAAAAAKARAAEQNQIKFDYKAIWIFAQT